MDRCGKLSLQSTDHAWALRLSAYMKRPGMLTVIANIGLINSRRVKIDTKHRKRLFENPIAQLEWFTRAA